jgi:hypothetical protein
MPAIRAGPNKHRVFAMKSILSGHGLFSPADAACVHADRVDVTRMDAALAVGSGTVFLAMYLRTLSPGLLPGDSGEFQTLAHFYSSAHTNGYPIYLLLAKLATGLPVGDIAYRVNLFSAWMAALAVAGVYLLGRLVFQNRWAALLSAAALGLSVTFWSQAIIAEVYSSAAIWTCAILCLILAWHRTGRGLFLFLTALLGGLSIGAHGTVVLAAPAVLVFIAVCKPDYRRIWKPALGGGLLGLALLLSAYWIADSNRAPYNIFNTVYVPAVSSWNMHPEDLQSPASRILFLITSRQWRPAMFADPLHVMPRNLRAFVRVLYSDYGPFLPLLMLAGMLRLLRREWRVGLLFAVATATLLIYILNYQIGDLNVFSVPVYVYLSVMLGSGVSLLLERLDRVAKAQSTVKGQPTFGMRALLLAGLSALIVLPHADLSWTSLVHGSYNASTSPVQGGAISTTGNPFEEQKAYLAWKNQIRATAGALEKNATVFMDWNNVYPYYYVSYLELGRTDLAFIEAEPYSGHSGLPSSTVDYIRSCQRPVYFLTANADARAAGLHFQAVQVGPTQIFQVMP